MADIVGANASGLVEEAADSKGPVTPSRVSGTARRDAPSTASEDHGGAVPLDSLGDRPAAASTPTTDEPTG